MLRRSVAVVLALVALAAQPAQAQSVEEFYKGKRDHRHRRLRAGRRLRRVRASGGAPHGQAHPGQSAIVVQNMPGAGSLTSVNYLYSVAPKDGTAFGIFARDMPMLALLGHNPNAKFDPRKFTWLGSSSNFADDAYVMIVRDDAPVKSIERDAQARRPGSWCSAAPPTAPPAATCRASCRRRSGCRI